ncbi:MAG: hypothetical protein JW987_00640 [Anaerolineaceae bacterium]|nr:hypothetical protein [Anaerolineaceae bacterium]
MSLSKHDFIDMLSQELAESPNKEQLLAYAKELIPGPWMLRQLKSLNSRKVLRANAAYAEFHPELQGEKHTIDQVVDWLMDAGAVPYARALEKRLERIKVLLEPYGITDPDLEYTISGALLIRIRANA